MLHLIGGWLTLVPKGTLFPVRDDQSYQTCEQCTNLMCQSWHYFSSNQCDVLFPFFMRSHSNCEPATMLLIRRRNRYIQLLHVNGIICKIFERDQNFDNGHMYKSRYNCEFKSVSLQSRTRVVVINLNCTAKQTEAIIFSIRFRKDLEIFIRYENKTNYKVSSVKPFEWRFVNGTLIKSSNFSAF